MSKAAAASSSGGGHVGGLAADRARYLSRARTQRYLDDIRMLRNLIALLPYAVKVRPPQIPAQRPQPQIEMYRPRAGRPADLWPRPRPNRFPDRRTGGHL